jgi:hypothetical protein
MVARCCALPDTLSPAMLMPIALSEALSCAADGILKAASLWFPLLVCSRRLLLKSLTVGVLGFYVVYGPLARHASFLTLLKVHEVGLRSGCSAARTD